MWRKRIFKWQPSKLVWIWIFGAVIKVIITITKFSNHTKLSRITPSQHCKPAAGITEALVWTGCCWSCCGACWATPFKMHVDFCPLLRETFAKPTRRPQPSARCASDEKQAPGVLVLGSGKASLLEVWLLHLGFVPPDFRSGYQCQPEIKTIKSTHYSWNNVRHDHNHARNYIVYCASI